MIKVYNRAASELFFPTPSRDPKSTKGVTLKLGLNEFNVDDLPPGVFRQLRIMHEDKHVTLETPELIEAVDGLPAIFPTEKSELEPKPEPKPEQRFEARPTEHPPASSQQRK